MNPAEAKATVVAVEPGESGGAPAVAVSVRFEDGRIERSDMRPDLVPDGLAAGDAILITSAALYRRWTIRKA